MNLIGIRRFSSCVSINKFPKLSKLEAIDEKQLLDFNRIFHEQKPILFKGLNQSWIACSKWKDVNYLKDKVKYSSSTTNVIVPVEVGEHYMDKNLQIMHLDFLELLDFFDLKSDTDNNMNAPKLYLAQFDIQEIPGLIDDIERPEITKTGDKTIYRSNIWLGGSSGSVTPCHNDPFNNVLCQVYGNKRIILFPPDSKDHLYLYDKYHKQKNTSRIDFTNVDIKQFPLFLEAKGGLICDLEPTDALFIPLRWYHFVESFKRKSCSINYWWL